MGTIKVVKLQVKLDKVVAGHKLGPLIGRQLAVLVGFREMTTGTYTAHDRAIKNVKNFEY